MPEDNLLQGILKGPATEHPSQEAKLRQALELMGGRRNSSGSGAQNAASVRKPGAAPAPRHRYVRDGEVPVVHAALGRAAGRPEPSAQQDKAALDTLRQELERERAARDAAERALTEMRANTTALQTRLAHLEMDLQAAQEHAAAQQAADRQAEEEPTAILDAATEAENVFKPSRRKPGSPRQRAVKPDREPTAEPVKWWIKTEKP